MVLSAPEQRPNARARWPADSAAADAPPLALYVHFPWCVKKCPYCDFNSHPRRGEIDQAGYVDALLRDLDHDLGRYRHIQAQGRRLSSIFLGGGTPSLFGAPAIGRLLREVGRRLAFEDGIEITLEANPGSLEHDRFAAYRSAGVNRLSLGVQSFDDAQLAALGRIHDADAARRAISAAVDAGFDNFNLDLMHGLPGQSVEGALRDLEAALAFAPSHLSLYQLTIEPNTWFHRHPPRLPQSDLIGDMQRRLQARAVRCGYRRYEVSSYATAGMRCRHNLNYWRFGDYLGIGAGAHGKITAAGAPERYWKLKHPQTYVAAAGGARALGGAAPVAGGEVLFEFLMNALRLTDGFDTALVRARTGRPAAEAAALLDDAVRRRWVLLSRGGRHIRCSARGYRLLDEILQRILPD